MSEDEIPEYNLEAMLVRACNLFREKLGPYPDLMRGWIDVIGNHSNDQTLLQLAHKRIDDCGKQIEVVFEETRQTIRPEHRDYVAVSSLRHDMSSTVTALYCCLETYMENQSQKQPLSSLKKYANQLEMWLHIDEVRDIPVYDIFTNVYDFLHAEFVEKKITVEMRRGKETVHVIPSFTIRRFYQTMRNAIKARNDHSQPYKIHLRSYVEGEYCVVEMSDHGTGIYPQVIKQAARAAGIDKEQPTLYDTITLIFKPGVSGFKHTGRQGTGFGLNSAVLAAHGGQDVALETTILHCSGNLLTIDKEHPNGYFNPEKTTTGTTFRYYLPLASTHSKT